MKLSSFVVTNNGFNYKLLNYKTIKLDNYRLLHNLLNFLNEIASKNHRSGLVHYAALRNLFRCA